MSEAVSSTEDVRQKRQRHYWMRFGESGANSSEGAKMPDGADLAAMRLGAGREPGAIPALWPFYTELAKSGGKVSKRLRAEHHTLVLFGFHQQSQRRLMDARGRSVGSAVLALRLSGRFKDEALNKRFIDTTLTDDVNELAIRLRGLITMLRGSEIGLGYELLFQHLVAWQNPTKRSATRRRWGADYSRVAIDLNGGTESHGKLSTT